jgi:hypothetical protein
MRNELFFTTRLTENEHFIVEDMIKDGCAKNGFDLIYYRKFKTGHVPTYRECKILGDLGKIRKMLDDLGIDYTDNYHRDFEGYVTLGTLLNLGIASTDDKNRFKELAEKLNLRH